MRRLCLGSASTKARGLSSQPWRYLPPCISTGFGFAILAALSSRSGHLQAWVGVMCPSWPRGMHSVSRVVHFEQLQLPPCLCSSLGQCPGSESPLRFHSTCEILCLLRGCMPLRITCGLSSRELVVAGPIAVSSSTSVKWEPQHLGSTCLWIGEPLWTEPSHSRDWS